MMISEKPATLLQIDSEGGVYFQEYLGFITNSLDQLPTALVLVKSIWNEVTTSKFIEDKIPLGV